MTPAEFAAITGGTLALLGIISVALKVVRAAHRAANRLERIETLASELAPNGGGSIKDAVHRIEQKVDENTETLTDHNTRIARAEGRIEAIALVTSPTMLIEDDEGVIREAKANAKGGA